MSEFADKVRSISVPRRLGQIERVPKEDERDGKVRGFEDKHWDGRQDALVIPRPVHVKMEPHLWEDD